MGPQTPLNLRVLISQDINKDANQLASADCLYDTTKQKAGLVSAKPGLKYTKI